MESLEFEDATLCVDRFGAPDDPAVLLIAGAAQSMDWWTPEFCGLIRDEGYQVIRYDHRDTGRSTTSPPGHPGYSAVEFTSDPVRILDSFGIDSAHLIGVSMGGGIAQTIAVEFPGRVRTLTLIATSPAGGTPPPLPPPTESVQATFSGDSHIDWSDPDAVLTHRVEGERPFAGSWGFDEARIRAIAALEIRRGGDIAAAEANHFLIAAETTVDPAAIRAPTLVVHGASDPMFPLPHGEALARMVPDSTLLVLDGMGHETPPPPAWSTLLPVLRAHLLSRGAHISRADSEAAATSTTWLSQTRRSYDIDAAGYAEQVRGLLAGHPHLRSGLQIFAEMIAEAGGGPVADIGCGPGYVTAHLHRLGVDSFGIDLSPEMVAIAHRDYPEIRFEVGTMTDLDLPEGSLAGALTFWSTIHIPDDAMPGVIDEFHRVLRGDGLLLLGFPVGTGVRHTDEGYTGAQISLDSHRREPETMTGWLRASGFVIVSETVIGPDEERPGGLIFARRQ